MLAAGLLLVGGAAKPPLPDADSRLTALARGTLLEDRALAPYNVGVQVHDRVATLWGPLPSEALARRAMQLLRSLPELTAVRSELRVEPDTEPARRMRAPSQPPRASGSGLNRVGLRRPGTLVGGAVPLPPARVLSQRVAPRRQTTPNRREPVAPPRKKKVFVLPAIEVGMGPEAPSPAPARRTAIPRKQPASSELERSLAELRSRDARFRTVAVAVDGGLVFLRAPAVQAEDLYQLAQVISRLPGVERVVVKEGPLSPR
jgi:hypothetical protein